MKNCKKLLKLARIIKIVVLQDICQGYHGIDLPVSHFLCRFSHMALTRRGVDCVGCA